MILLKILLTADALLGLFRLGTDPRLTDRTAYIPLSHRRFWSVCELVLTLLLWSVETWPVILAAILSMLMAAACHNTHIVWDDKKFRIAGMMGLEWTYEYAQLRYLPGKLPLLVTNDRIFLLWPWLVWRDTFIAHAKERWRITAYAQQYRKRAYIDPKQNVANRSRMLSSAGAALLIAVLTAYFCWPITESTGETVQQVLREARLNGSHIDLYFDGSREHRLPYHDATAELLEADALGQTYTVQRQYRASAGKYSRKGWYIVIALTGPDGTVYRTWQESEAALRHSRPHYILVGCVGWFLLHQSIKSNPKKRR